MITIGYSTRESNPQYKEHIKKTSNLNGIEIIEVVNGGDKSLTEVYNSILGQSKHKIVVLIHDDLILPQNWGKQLLKGFNSDFGIIGVAGTTFIPENGVWWGDRNKMIGVVNHKWEGKTHQNKYSQVWKGEIKEVVAVDGLFIAINKDKLQKGFNESFKGFHFYDIPFCIDNYNSGVKIGVTFDFVVTHKSIGQTNEQWEGNRKQFSETYQLPVLLNPEPNFSEEKISLKEYPEISIIIPHKDKNYLIKDLLESFYLKEDYDFNKIHFYIADTGSSPENKEELKNIITDYRVKKDKEFNINLIEYDYYNFAKINNDVVKYYVDTELILFCNNDVKLLNNSLSRLVRQYLKNPKKIGTLGSRMYFENNTIQHNGIVIYLNKDRNIQISHKGLHSHYNFSDGVESVIGNTGAFMMIRKDLFDSIGGFNENYSSCFEDMELNLESIVKGKYNLNVGDSVLYHYESLTRNDDVDKIKKMGEDGKNILFPFIDKNFKYFKSYLNRI